MRDVAIVEAPSALGLFPRGVQEAPDALLAAGLAGAAARARRTARVAPPAYDPARDPATGVLNAPGIAAYAGALADAVGGVLARGAFPLVLGGDCSILLGGLLALRRAGGRPGLLFLDGHEDFYLPAEEPHGEAASMDLALATGRGPGILADLEGLGPLVRDADVAALGARDRAGGDPDFASGPLPPDLLALDLAAVRAVGASAAAGAALDRLTRPGGPAGFWVHLDVDVLDDALMPAVDYRMPGGLDREELGTVLRAALGSSRALGLEVTIFNPRLDPGGRLARELACALAGALAALP